MTYEFDVGDVVVQIGDDERCEVAGVDEYSGYLIRWEKGSDGEPLQCWLPGELVERLYVKVDEWDYENKRMKGVENV